MIRPESAPVYDQIDLKLGIKSSLPSVKPTLALLFLMWREMGRPSELEYGLCCSLALEQQDVEGHPSEVESSRSGLGGPRRGTET